MDKKRLLVIGLDCASPQLIFDELKEAVPTITSLANMGYYGKLQSIIPPITVPAWMSMLTGKDPGELGIYGFRNRSSYLYNSLTIANSHLVKERVVWDIMADYHKKTVSIGVPLTYPPKKINGWMLSCFLTPSPNSNYTYPANLKQEVGDNCGDYIVDVENFRTNDKDRLLEAIFELTRNRFKIAKYLINAKDWHFFMMVEMGPDRLHHGFWKYFDTSHPKYQDTKYSHVFRDYYSFLDSQINSLLHLVDDQTAVMIVSDHGAKKMDGGIRLNEWLLKNKYLSLLEYPDKPAPLSKVKVDWSKTLAWGEGGYYGRVFLNVVGREPQGVIPSQNYEKIRDELSQALREIKDEKGKNIGTKVFKPEEIYRTVKGIAPDLIVYFGNLDWRSIGTVGVSQIYTHENDTGPDDANHAEEGIFIYFDPQNKLSGGQMVENLSLYDIAPTILTEFNIPVPSDMQGKPLQDKI